MPALPNGIRPINTGFSVGAPGGVSRVVVGGGLPRYGLEFERGVQAYSVTLRLSDTEFSVWSAFYHHTLKEGALAIDDLPLDAGMGVQECSATILPGTYTYRRAGGAMTEVSFEVEALSAAYDLTEAEALDLIADFESANGPLLQALRPMTAEYSGDGTDSAWRSEVPGGLPAYAGSWDRSCQRHQVAMLLDATQYAAWTAYFHHVIGKGAYPFSMYLDSGFGAMEHTVQIVPGTYRATRRGVRTVVNFLAEAESALYGMTRAEAADFIEVWNDVGADLDDLLARIARFANEDTLVLDL